MELSVSESVFFSGDGCTGIGYNSTDLDGVIGMGVDAF